MAWFKYFESVQNKGSKSIPAAKIASEMSDIKQTIFKFCPSAGWKDRR